MKELVKPIKEVQVTDAVGYCESNGACSNDKGKCTYNGCNQKSYTNDQELDDILF